jgi:hypothetical protein
MKAARSGGAVEPPARPYDLDWPWIGIVDPHRHPEYYYRKYHAKEMDTSSESESDDPKPPCLRLSQALRLPRYDRPSLAACWEALYWAHVADDCEYACWVLMDRWLQETTSLYYTRDPHFVSDLKYGLVKPPCLNACDIWARDEWMQTDHDPERGLWQGPPFPDKIMVCGSFWVEGLPNPYRFRLCPVSQCSACDGSRSHSDSLEAKRRQAIQHPQVGTTVTGGTRVVFAKPHRTDYDKFYRLNIAPKARWMLISTLRQTTRLLDGSLIIVETPNDHRVRGIGPRRFTQRPGQPLPVLTRVPQPPVTRSSKASHPTPSVPTTADMHQETPPTSPLLQPLVPVPDAVLTADVDSNPPPRRSRGKRKRGRRLKDTAN